MWPCVMNVSIFSLQIFVRNIYNYVLNCVLNASSIGHGDHIPFGFYWPQLLCTVDLSGQRLVTSTSSSGDGDLWLCLKVVKHSEGSL